MVKSYKILIVEDDDGLRYLIQSQLEREGFNVFGVRLGEEAVKWSVENHPSLVLLDYKLPDIKAEEVIDLISSNKNITHFIIITGHIDIKTAVDMMKLGVKDYLIKDSNFLDLLPTVITRVFEEYQKEIQLKQAQEALYRSEESYKLLADSLVDVIWMTDIDMNIIYLSQSITQLLGYSREELISEKIDKMLSPESAVIANEFINKALNDIIKNGTKKEDSRFKNTILELEQICKDGSIVWTEVRISFMFDSHMQVTGILGVTRDITGRKKAAEDLQESFKTLRRALEASVEAMGKTTEIRDPYTAGHQKRVCILAYEIAKGMNLQEDTVEGIRLAGAIHDIGKIYVPAEILSKPGKISENEFNIIKTHAQVGYDILKTIDFPWPIAKIVLQHHERIDGSGYPSGLKGDEILIEAKIIGVADVVEAMASHRPYRPSLGIAEAIKEIKKNRGITYDPEVVDVCCDLIVNKGFNFI